MRDSINYWAVLVSAGVSLLLGFLWYTMLFRVPYIAGLGKTKAEMDAGPTAIEASAMQFVGNLVLAYVLAWLMEKLGYDTPLLGMKLAVLVWLGFVVANIGPMHAFQAFSLQFSLITVGGMLVSLLATGAILGFWR